MKIAERQAKQAAKVVKEVVVTGEKKEKVKPVKEKQEAEALFVNHTPKGHKKGAFCSFHMVVYTDTIILYRHVATHGQRLQSDLGRICLVRLVGITTFFALKTNEDGSPQDASKGTFIILASPPNVTGALDIKHSLTVAIQDTLIRWCAYRPRTIKFHFRTDVSCTSRNRMFGKVTLFVPGFDHAEMSIQSVVEKDFRKDTP